MTSFPRLEETLTKLISFRTVTGNNDEMRALLSWVKEDLQGLPLFFRNYERNGVPSLIITTREGQKNPKVWLACHVDVVDGPDKVWKPHTKDGRLYGRGAFDMKFAAACYIELLKGMGQSLAEYDLGVMLTGDEEVGGFESTKALLDEEGYRGGVVFLPDGGGTWQFEEAAKGMWSFELTAMGKSAHSSRPWEGDNAIITLSRLLTELYALAQEYWIDTPEHWHLTYNVGLMNGGTTFNSLADCATASIDVRSTSEEERSEFASRVRDVLERYPTVELHQRFNEVPYGISRELESVNIFARIARDTYGIECGWVKSHGSSDARHFTVFGVPSILITPECGGKHQDEEWIDLPDLERFCVVMQEWIRRIASHTASGGVSNIKDTVTRGERIPAR